MRLSLPFAVLKEGINQNTLYFSILESIYLSERHSTTHQTTEKHKKMNFISKSASTIFSRVSSNTTMKNMFQSATTNAATTSNVCFMGTKTLFKTNRAASKRIRLRGSGSVKR
jgi:hypothetical protein